MGNTLRLLKDLIATPSVNPAFLPAGHRFSGEGNVGELLAAAALKIGLDVESQEVATGRRNVLIRLSPPGRPSRRIWLAPHADTVNGDELSFKPRVSRGRVYGRGACDTKGSLACFFMALRDLAVARKRPNVEITLAVLADEECAQLGSRALAASGLKADLAIVGEPTLNKVVTAHKGNLWVQVETFGKAAHGSRPDLGVNAIRLMAQAVDILEGKYSAGLRSKKHPLLGHATINVGAIQGGSQPNIVPDHCKIQIDRRTLPGETDRAVLSEIRKALDSVKPGVRVSMLRAEECLPMETNPKLELVALLLRAVGQSRPAGARYFCDASILSRAGIPSVVFGPGDIAQAHTSDEWISVDSLEECRRLLGRFLRAVDTLTI
jgi:acetylornithine deacetylase/succinyl-diaminopimelate desuccinylase family protein